MTIDNQLHGCKKLTRTFDGAVTLLAALSTQVGWLKKANSNPQSKGEVYYHCFTTNEFRHFIALNFL